MQSQELDQSYLNTLGDEPLLTLFDTHTGDSIAQEKIARTYLDRARTQRDTIKMARGYDRLARIFHPEKNIAFADSIIALTKDIKNITYPAMGYFLKAYNYKAIDEFNQFFINTKMGYDVSVLNNNRTLQTYASNNLVFYKSIWGDANEALKMQKREHEFILSKNYKMFIAQESRKSREFDIDSLQYFDIGISYQNLTHCFLNLRKLDSARYYNKISKDLSKSVKHNYSDYFWVWSIVTDMEIEYYDNNYKETISIGNDLLHNKKVIEAGYLNDVTLFLGLSYFDYGDKLKGVELLNKTDSIFMSKGMKDFFPYERLVYTKLLDYSYEKGDLTNQIKYLGRIILVDSVLKSRYSFFEPKLINEFETPQLMAEKQMLINKLKKENQAPDPKVYIVLAALVTSLCFLFYYVQKRQVYKKRFEALVTKTNKQKLLSLHDSEYKNELSVEVVEDILQKLERFERQHKFLRPDITLHSLAKECKTNTNYLSRVINLKLEKNFSQYIHDLRITYAVEELLSNPAYRKYTIKAIAEECGYTNSESFSRAFYKINGIYPSYYIKKLDKEVG